MIPSVHSAVLLEVSSFWMFVFDLIDEINGIKYTCTCIRIVTVKASVCLYILEQRSNICKSKTYSELIWMCYMSSNSSP